MMPVTFQEIRQAINGLGLSGHALCLHSSLRSFGRVEGGASTVVQGLLAEGCTVLVSTFSWDAFAVPAPPGMRPARNGYNYTIARSPFPGVNRVYTAETEEIDKDMGAIPTSVVAHPSCVRGNHPLCSFSTVGPLGQVLIAGQGPLQVFAPFEALIAAQGFVVMMGVDLTSMTLLHYAEQKAGRYLFRRWANGPDGQPMEVETGGCSDGFEQLAPLLVPCERRIQVGQSVWRIFSAKDVFEVAQQAIQQNPAITHCDDEDCGRCRDAIAGGPILRE